MKRSFLHRAWLLPALIVGLALSLPGCDAIDDLRGNDGHVADGLHPVLLDGEWGYVNNEGRMVIEPQFREAYAFVDGRARVRGPRSWRTGYINTRGELVIDNQFEEGLNFSGGLAAVKFDGLWGYV
ncbi:MAG: WG repeat-containing protein, partial [Bacteroidota bacterium]